MKFTVRSPNEIVIYDGYAGVVLRDRFGEQVGISLIDLDDINRVSKYKWYYSRGYAKNSTGKGFLHNFILDRIPDKDYVVDHINRDRLDNRTENLRVVNYSLNGFNKGRQSNNTSGHVGVSWDKRKQKWESHIKQNGKKKFLGYFNELEDAVKCRKKAELEYYGQLRNEEYDVNTVFKKEGLDE